MTFDVRLFIFLDVVKELKPICITIKAQNRRYKTPYIKNKTLVYNLIKPKIEKFNI